MSETWTKLPPIESPTPACATCGAGGHAALELDDIVGVGFGSAGFSRDGKILWQEGSNIDDEHTTVADVEELAADDPDHDWRIFYYAPLHTSVYQRQGEGHWVMVERGDGFA